MSLTFKFHFILVLKFHSIAQNKDGIEITVNKKSLQRHFVKLCLVKSEPTQSLHDKQYMKLSVVT